MLLKGNELAIQNTRFLKKNVYAPEGWMLWKFSRTPKMDSDECMNWWKNMFWKHWVDYSRENESWALVSHDHKSLMLECPHGCMHDQFCIKIPFLHPFPHIPAAPIISYIILVEVLKKQIICLHDLICSVCLL